MSKAQCKICINICLLIVLVHVTLHAPQFPFLGLIYTQTAMHPEILHYRGNSSVCATTRSMDGT